MNVKALTIAGIAVAVAIATTVVLNLAKPIKHEEVHVAAGPTAESVFSNSIDNPGAPPADAETAAAPAQAAPAAEAPAAQTPSEVAAPAAEPAPATSEAEPAPTAAAAEPVPASEPATEAPPAAEAPAESQVAAAEPVADVEPSGGTSAPASSGEAPRGGCGPAIMPSPTTGTSGGKVAKAAAAPSAPAAAPPPPPAQMAAAPEAPAPEPAAAPAPAPKPKAITKAKPKAPAPPPKDATKAWWPAGGADKLNVTFVGEASFTKAIVVLTDGTFNDASSANANIKVTKGGAAVPAKWLVATNKKMLLLNVDPGKYTVKIGAGLKDAAGKGVGASGSGPVYVH